MSINEGQTFSDPDNISEDTGNSIDPQISSEENNVYMVWFINGPDNNDINPSFSHDGGLTFSTPPGNLNNTIRDWNGPQISSTTS